VRLRSLVVLAALVQACTGTDPLPPGVRDAGTPRRDAGPPDPGRDAGFRDAGARDGGAERDAGFRDGGTDRDAGERDAGPPPPIVVLMIGDGMGFPQLEAAGHYAHGRTGNLAIERLPVHGEIRTASLSGLTDSAASATAMATGIKTRNRRVGVDARGDALETIVETAKARGFATGVVSTAALSHATPASFSAHWSDRDGFGDIAASQAVVQPDVMLGGGALYLDAHVATFEGAGYRVARTSAELDALAVDGTPVLGLFSAEHMPYVLDRTDTSTVPSLAAMSLAALDQIDATGRGGFLTIEGARIDMAAHLNDRDRMITETVDFDDAVSAVARWIERRENATLIVTADHECGGVTVANPRGAGVFPQVDWRWDQHTNQRVGVFASGPGTAIFDGTTHDNTMIYAAVRAQLLGEALVDPAPGLVVDGHLSDLAHRASTQVVVSGFGPGFNQLDALLVDADADRLAVGVEGLFQWGENAVVLLVDVDFGAGTGFSNVEGALSDFDGRLDGIITALNVRDPSVTGFGVDAAVGVWGGTVLRDEDLIEDAGFRGFANGLGAADNFFWTAVSTNFGEGVRSDVASAAVSDEGWEVHVPWRALFPTLEGRVPAGATLAIAAVLVNDDGGFLSNQVLPPFPSGTENPGRTGAALPGVVVFDVDVNADGIPGDTGAPTVQP
jgi:alkaline phosphatase